MSSVFVPRVRVVLTITNGALQEVRKGFTWGEVTIVPLLEEEEEDGDEGEWDLSLKSRDDVGVRGP